ncbi:hypothetical protein GOEFS_036_00590 [Gordonia effusa NBRC 100432]|uniref:Uncharacterized protein n=1 Tax=Gordonia effusa NBRC 100432 TaxID=1077974 RepID=H0QXR9_9ACTN|nr:hypothetical protein [Gordonia effusa]GAB17620.1 hypothetical protein GOEFS_036_00590 [Gordonia effusa NBRC 100432]
MSTRKRDRQIPQWLGVMMTAYGSLASLALVVLYAKAGTGSSSGTLTAIGASWSAAISVALVVAATMTAGIRLANSRLQPAALREGRTRQ